MGAGRRENENVYIKLVNLQLEAKHGSLISHGSLILLYYSVFSFTEYYFKNKNTNYIN